MKYIELILAVVLACAGCDAGGPDDSGSETEVGPGGDASSTMDGRTAGNEVDAGVGGDGGERVDADGDGFTGPSDGGEADALDSGQRDGDADADPVPVRLLVFTKTEGYRHGSIGAGIDAVESIAEDRGWTVEQTEDAGRFTADELEAFDVVVWLNTTGDVLDGSQQSAFERWVEAGGGYVGVHAAADTEYDWSWYGSLVGAWFESHPSVQSATIDVEDRAHPSTEHLDASWTHRDEWYNYRRNPRGDVQVLMTVDEETYEGGGMGADHPIAWYHSVSDGRAFYTGLGHTSEAFGRPVFREHLAGAIRWAADR